MMRIIYPDYGTSLDSKLKNSSLSEASAISMLEQVLSALDWMHEKEVVHYDVNFTNVLFGKNQTESEDNTDPKVVLIDYGKSKSFHQADIEETESADRRPLSFSEGVADDLESLLYVLRRVNYDIPSTRLEQLEVVLEEAVDQAKTLSDTEQLKHLTKELLSQFSGT